MECNKEEAARAIQIAENKLVEKDIAGAERFATKAKSLYPELDGLPQFLAAVKVYMSYEKRIDGEVDWYEVLDVEPSADVSRIRKHYLNLALILHPDKNKSASADGAFKIVSEAWSLLSDISKRTAYDKKRNLSGVCGVVQTGKPSVSCSHNNTFHNFTNDDHFNATNLNSDTHSNIAPPAFCPSNSSTFWTICNACRMQFEYSRTYVNHNLLCPNCKKPFCAVEKVAPLMKHQHNFSETTINCSSYAPGRGPPSATNMGLAGFAGVNSLRNSHFQSGPQSARCGRTSIPTFSTSGVVSPSCEQIKEIPLRKTIAFKKTSEDFVAMSSNSCSISEFGDRPKKRKHVDGQWLKNNITEMSYETETGIGRVDMGGSFGYRKGNVETGRVNVFGRSRPSGAKELTQLGNRNNLINKAKKNIQKKINEWSRDTVPKTADKPKRTRKEANENKKGKKGCANVVKSDAYKCTEAMGTINEIHPHKSSPSDSGIDSDIPHTDVLLMSVQDPDFHDFDKDRTEKSFGDSEVWAAYDDDDGMPRYYAMIHRVISVKPFKMQISWLNSKRNDELAPLNWIASGFYKTSGDFWVGKYEVYKSLNSFSHKVKWAKGPRGAIRIFPMKGDIWALYRNWTPNWNELTPNEVIHKYDMVEVLEDYSEEKGVTVAPLVKVSGFKTVFRRNSDPSRVKRISKEEIFRLSHQVPCYLLTGQEGPDAPKDCMELDPASLPLDLLQVTTDIGEQEMAGTRVEVKEEILTGDINKCKEQEQVGSVNTIEGKETTEESKKNIVEGVKTRKGNEAKEGLKVYTRRRQRK